MSDIGDLKERVYEANMDLVREGLVIHTFGNVSGIDRSRGLVAIKPSGVPYDDLTPDDIVVVDMEGCVLEGGRPSSDTRTHLVLYRNFPCIGGVAHTHSSFASSWAQAQRSIPCLGTTHADSLPGSVPCTRTLDDSEIGGDYETATGNVIVELFGSLSPVDTEMALVASHGPFTWGATPEKAVLNSLLLEEIARTAFRTLLLNPAAAPIGKALHNRHFSRKHGVDAYYGQK
jgi:L-ribulose-5-phosphate 4-epimerase